MERLHFIHQIERYFESHKIVALLGPRQCGKTTLARMYSKREVNFSKNNYLDLEASIDVQRLVNPTLTLESLSGLIIIDEIQRIPDLFPILRVLVDREENNQRYLILGSASRELIRQSSESLAGRIAYIELTPFSFQEVDDIQKLWIRGGFPRSFLAKTEQESVDWREFYIRTFLEQDIPNLGIKIPPDTLRRFWIMLSHYHGNIFNSSELARSFGTSDVTIRRYLDILAGTFMIRKLQPWHENISKRQVKAPKIYFRDSGIFHSLLNISNQDELQVHPKLGASWEGFALEEVIRHRQAKSQDCYFWSTYGGAEVDLILHQKGTLTGFEFKYSDAPQLTKSMHTALHDLQLDHLYVIYPGDVDYPLSERISVKGLKSI
ncbi:MAG: ATP-binding protein [Chlamydiales bacterium]|nr:ATP-binding protein [Chlamydiales bacterium]